MSEEPNAVPSVVRYRTDDGCRVAILTMRGRKFLHLVWIEDTGVRAYRRALGEEKHMAPLEYCPVEAALRMMEAGARLGLAKSAEVEFARL